MSTTETEVEPSAPEPGPSSSDGTSPTNDATVPARADNAEGESGRAERLFTKSIVISGIRCLLAYIVLPFVTPFIGLAPGVSAELGLIIGVVAIVANLFSIRRFWRADHRWKVPVTVLHIIVIAMLTLLIVNDIRELMG